MANQDKSLNDIILSSATDEFREKGFEYASLRTIAKKANATTGAIYRRYKDKNELFEAVVLPAITSWQTYCNSVFNESMNSLDSNQGIFHNSEYMKRTLDAIYDEYDAMSILLLKSHGSKYENYLNKIVEDNFSITIKFINKINEHGYSLKITQKEYHSFLSIYWKAVFEVIFSDYSYDEGLQYLNNLKQLFNWAGVIGFDK